MELLVVFLEHREFPDTLWGSLGHLVRAPAGLHMMAHDVAGSKVEIPPPMMVASTSCALLAVDVRLLSGDQSACVPDQAHQRQFCLVTAGTRIEVAFRRENTIVVPCGRQSLHVVCLARSGSSCRVHCPLCNQILSDSPDRRHSQIPSCLAGA